MKIEACRGLALQREFLLELPRELTAAVVMIDRRHHANVVAGREGRIASAAVEDLLFETFSELG